MCLLCASVPDPAGETARRVHVLRLLSLVEQPDALPAEAALRLSREIIALIGQDRSLRRCERVVSDSTAGECP